MNQPTREEFEALKEEVRQLREQITEPIKITRVEVASADVVARLDNLKQELHAISNTWLDTLQEHYAEHKQDISDVKTVQKGHSKYFEEHGKRLAATASKEDTSELKATVAEQGKRLDTKLDQVLALLQQKPRE